MEEKHWLLSKFEEYDQKEAIIWRDQKITYRQLLEKVAQWRDVLRVHHICAGECVVISSDATPPACALLLALFFNRNIIVPLTTSAASKKTECQDVANANAIFEFDPAGSWGVFRRATGPAHPLILQLQSHGAPGLILFSSGSTGTSKAALLNCAKLVKKFKTPRPGYRTLIFLLLDHIGGINTLFYTLSHGGTMVLIDDRRPESVCHAIAEHRIQLLPTTPTFLTMLLMSEAYTTYDLSSLELITYGTEPMPASTLNHLCAVFPAVRIKQTYGLSEVGILSTKSQYSHSLWIKVGGEGYETKVVDNTLWIRADTAMLGYLNAPSPFAAHGWFNTGDVVETQGDYLRILGRTSDIINVGGEKVYPAEVESVLLDMENIREVVVTGKSNAVTGQVVIAHVHLERWEDPDALRRRMRRFCKGRLAPYKIPTVVEIRHEPLYSARFKKSRVSREA